MNNSGATSTNAAVAPRPAATVMLVRDAAAGVEVFMLQRSMRGAFGGVHAFPGGKLEAADADAAWGALCRGVTDAQASRTLGLARGGLAYWVACIRECFEEVGLLLAEDSTGAPLRLHEAAARARFANWRVRLNAGETDALQKMCSEEGLFLAAHRLAYVSHWVTPRGEPARFNTRFFVARAPAEQRAAHDGFEAVHSLWLRPEDALQQCAAGALKLISPTRNNLQAITGYESTAALLAAKHRADAAAIPAIRPRFVAGAAGGAGEEVLEVISSPNAGAL